MNCFDNIILGGGPGALQCGSFFEEKNINYTIIEKNDKAGSFFESYPHSETLISINKKNTGSDNENFNLRHDWNSLLGGPNNYKFTEYSDAYYPKSEHLVKYLNDVAIIRDLKIIFNTNIVSVEIINELDYNYNLTDSNNNIFKCKKLIIATGLSQKVIPNFEINVVDEIKHYADFPKKYFKNRDTLNTFINKDVCIIGGGNASYEIANIINEYCRSVTIFANGHRPWAMSSHYSGDIRSIYLPFLDTFHLKSLNAIDKSDRKNSGNKITQTTNNGKYILSHKKNDFYQNYSNINYDTVIFCTGWKFDTSIYKFEIDMFNYKLPRINNNYESTNNKNLFFIGALMQSLDYRKSSGGFIHGFRHLIDAFVRINYTKFNTHVLNLNVEKQFLELIETIVRRINNSSAMYQMFGFIGDIFYYNLKEKQTLYYKDIPINYYNRNLEKHIIRFVITLEYGNEITHDVSKLGEKYSKIGSESKSTLIHPVIRIYSSENRLLEVVHLDEDLYAEFNKPMLYKDRIYRLLKSYEQN